MTEAILAALWALWRASWQGTILITLLWCVCRALERRLSPDVRCWLWRAVSIKMLLGLVIATRISLPVLPEPMFVSSLPQPALVIERALPETFPVSKPGEGAIDLTRATVPATVTNPTPFPWPHILIVLYLTGVVACLVRVFQAGYRARQVIQQAIKSTEIPAEKIGDLVCFMGIRKIPRLLHSPAIDIPVYMAGAILLPEAADYSAEERRLIFAHELAHARRHDLAWEWLGTLTQILFFFHPFVFLARREERLARESAADAIALRVTQAPASLYGKLLLSISLTERRIPALAGAIGALESDTSLRRRLLALKEVSTMPSLSRTSVSYAVIAGLAMILPWQITAKASSPREKTMTRLPGPLTAPAALQDPRTGQLYLRNVPALPLIPLSKALGLTPDQQIKVAQIQKRTSEQLIKELLNQTEQRRQLIESYLPDVHLSNYGAKDQGEWVTATRMLQRNKMSEWARYSKEMRQTIEIGKQNTKKIEDSASQNLLAVLTESQEQALPTLLLEASQLQSLGIPQKLYTDLTLDGEQKRKIASIAQNFGERYRQIIAANIAAVKEENTKSLNQADSKDRQAESQRRQRLNRSFDEMRESLSLLRQQKHDAALTVLNSKQRSIVTSYLKAHPQPAVK